MTSTYLAHNFTGTFTASRAIDAIYDGLKAGRGLREVTGEVAVQFANDAIATGGTFDDGIEVGKMVCALALDIQRDLLARYRPAHADYPHDAGYLFGCPACEVRCHCAPGADRCVFPGFHRPV
ncbi:hypothetical protein [Micromonospora sediminicola]|uniref:hypothetical protein n=1 Tax=Micromonospora sediminicola TaxID=946078 RepID=UPI0037994C09